MFYTYLWLREDGTPYYVGKGKGSRAFRSGCPVIAVVEEYIEEPDKNRIIIQEHPSEVDAFQAEIFLIVYYGRKDLGKGCLRNLTDGGEGVVNVSEETRSKMRKPKSEAAKLHMRKPKTETARANMCASKTKELRLKVSNAMLGNKIHPGGRKENLESV